MADAVILAVPAFAAAELLDEVDPEVASHLKQVDYSFIAAVALALPPPAESLAAGSPLAGTTGFLVPPDEQRVLKSCSVLSAKWPHLAPPDGGLLRS